MKLNEDWDPYPSDTKADMESGAVKQRPEFMLRNFKQIFKRMRCVVVLFLILTVVINCQKTLAQSKSKTVAWMNDQGEKILRDITGNSSIQWQMDEYGRLKITNYEADKEGKSSIVKHYSYLNLYELDSKGVLVEKSPEKNSANRLLLQCKAEKKACIKSRHYETSTNFKTIATPALNFRLKMNFDKAKGERLKEVLIHAIKLFQKGT